jgi:hypothetical protein
MGVTTTDITEGAVFYSEFRKNQGQRGIVSNISGNFSLTRFSIYRILPVLTSTKKD